jgi:hypothetical protein
MPSKKQRRRRQKLQRHEYEYVVENEEGEDVVVESRSAREARAPAKEPAKLVDRRGREVQPPSWRRVLKRGLIFGPLMLVLVYITGGQLSTAAKILNAVVLLAIFLPFSYLIDSLVYRSMLKRQRRGAGR